MRIITRFPTLEADKVSGFFAAPPGNVAKPGVLFIHHANGNTAEIRENAERLARLGYAAFAVNMFHALGAMGEGQMGMGAPMQQKHKDAEFLKAIMDGWNYLVAQPGVDRKRTGAVGYCMGARLAIEFALENPELRAIVPNYPSIRDEQPSDHRPRIGYDSVKSLKCATCLIWGGRDAVTSPEQQLRVVGGLMGNGQPLEYHFFHDAAHGFVSMETANHHADVAHRIWPITVDFLDRYVANPL
ncbi:MAG: dienelactone hydrolase family protein [Burkholderiales bacterium]